MSDVIQFRRAERDERLARFTEQWRKDGLHVVVDNDVAIVPLIRALNAGGFTISNGREGLVIHHMPAELA